MFLKWILMDTVVLCTGKMSHFFSNGSYANTNNLILLSAIPPKKQCSVRLWT